MSYKFLAIRERTANWNVAVSFLVSVLQKHSNNSLICLGTFRDVIMISILRRKLALFWQKTGFLLISYNLNEWKYFYLTRKSAVIARLNGL